MKRWGLICLALSLTTFAGAQDKVVQTRSLSQYGAMVTWGADTGLGKLGWGVSTRGLTYLDPTKPDGLYYTFGSGTLAHSAGGLTIADTKLLMVGWRQEALVENLSFDLSVAPVLGARYDGKTEIGSLYTGAGATAGAYYQVWDGIDVGLSVEPVVNLYNWGSAPAKNLTYCDLVFYVVTKANTETKTLAWK